MSAPPPGVASEHAALCRHLGSVQDRVSTLMREKDMALKALASEVVRLRGQLVVAHTARLWGMPTQAPEDLEAARKLGLELAEGAAIQHFELLQEMGRQLRPLGVKLGLEHAGVGLAQVDRLYQAGLDYVKLDAAVVAGVSGDAARAAFVRGMVIMLRSLALKVYAEGVVDGMDVQALWDCELDGVTGPWATAQA